LSWSQEWTWGAAVAAIPVIVFAAYEMTQLLRRRRFEALARRPKAPRHRPPGRID